MTSAMSSRVSPDFTILRTTCKKAAFLGLDLETTESVVDRIIKGGDSTSPLMGYDSAIEYKACFAPNEFKKYSTKQRIRALMVVRQCIVYRSRGLPEELWTAKMLEDRFKGHKSFSARLLKNDPWPVLATFFNAMRLILQISRKSNECITRIAAGVLSGDIGCLFGKSKKIERRAAFYTFITKGMSMTAAGNMEGVNDMTVHIDVEERGPAKRARLEAGDDARVTGLGQGGHQNAGALVATQHLNPGQVWPVDFRNGEEGAAADTLLALGSDPRHETVKLRSNHSEEDDFFDDGDGAGDLGHAQDDADDYEPHQFEMSGASTGSHRYELTGASNMSDLSTGLLFKTKRSTRRSLPPFPLGLLF